MPPLSSQEKDNLTRWNGSRKGFYEVYYLKWNDPTRGIAAWLRYTLLSPRTRPPEASLWGIFFDAKDPKNNLAIKRTFPAAEARIEREIFYFGIGPSAVFDRGARGTLSDEKNRLAWEFKFGEGLTLRHFPSPLYATPFPKTKFLAPYLSTRLTGEFTVNDRTFSLENVPAHQAHLWGTQHAASWIWGNCNAFAEDPDFCFEGLSVKVPVGARTAPPMTLLFFYWDGKFYSFNSPFRWFSNKSWNELDRWHFEAGTKDLKFVGDVFSSPEQMVGVRYEDPDGSERFCHNTKVADLRIQVLKKTGSGWACLKTLSAERTCAFEVVEPSLDPRVRLMIP